MSNRTTFANENVFDSRDVEARIEALENDFQIWKDEIDSENDRDEDDLRQEWIDATSEGEEWGALDEFRCAVDDSEWQFGMGFIADSYFVDYAEESAYDDGDVDRDSQMTQFIDWDAYAEWVKTGYSSIELEGETFWYHS